MIGPRLLTVAHGTRHRSGNEVAARLTEAAGARIGLAATATYVELCAPLLTEELGRFRGPAIVVPLLLSTGHHVRHDLPAALGERRGVRLAPTLGPDRALAALQAERLRAAGGSPGDPVVMVAAGSADPAAMTDLRRARDLLAEAWAAPVRLATLGGLGRRPAEVVRPGDLVSPYLLAEGHFAARARDAVPPGGAAGAVLGVHDLLVDLVVERAAALLGRREVA